MPVVTGRLHCCSSGRQKGASWPCARKWPGACRYRGHRQKFRAGRGSGYSTARLVTDSGEDVTAAFLAGAAEAQRLVQLHDIRIAVLKARSPSCGNLHNYDGSFSGRKVAGMGVTAAALQRLGVQLFNEEQLAQAQRCLQQLESPARD